MFITNAELILLQPYLTMAKVVHVDIKETKKAKEVMIEFENGDKYVGDLKKSPFIMEKVRGLTTIASYFARGEAGSNTWRGNCSGLLIENLLEHFRPETFADYTVGSGTSKDVALKMGYTERNTIFSDLNPAWGGVDIADRKQLDFPLVEHIFYHPPYFVFEGSNMPTYSGNMWGKDKDLRDGSHMHDPEEFTKWFNLTLCNLYQCLEKGGRMSVLMGDSRYKGKLYSMLKEMNVPGELEHIIIKTQHNNYSDNIKYSGKFIPIMHEYLCVIKKDGSSYLIPMTITKHEVINVKNTDKITWKALIQSFIEENGGKIEKKELLKELKQHPKAKDNNFVEEKLRQILNTYTELFKKEDAFIRLNYLSAC